MKGLLQLDLSKFYTGLGELGLNRLLMGCRSTLQYISLPFNTPAVSQMTLSTVGTMTNLSSIHLGSPHSLYKLDERTSKLKGLKSLFKSIKNQMNLSRAHPNSTSPIMSLKTLSIYECDLSLLKIIAETQAHSLERLTIACWH
jgi:hypothetical protein